MGRVDRRSDRPHHATGDPGRRLTVAAHAPQHAVRTVRYEDVAVRQLGPDAVDTGPSAGIRKRTPDADSVRLEIHRDPDHAVAALLGNQKGARPVLPALLHDSLGFLEARGEAFHQSVRIEDRNCPCGDVAEVQACIEAQGQVIGCRQIPDDKLRTTERRRRRAGGQRGRGRARRRRGLGRRYDGRLLTGGQHRHGDQRQPPAMAFDPDEVPVYDGLVLKVISAPELARNLDPILQALEESGTTLIIKHHDQPAALLVRFDAYVAMLATMDYSGWERWIEEVRAAFPTSVFSPPRRPKSVVPAFIDPEDIGYAPQHGQVGTTAGRRRLAEGLETMGIQLGERQLWAVHSLVLSLAERKRVLYAEDLKLAVDEALGRATPGRYALKEVQVHSQSGLSSHAEVSIIDDGKSKTGTASGNGTLDAVFRAIQAVTCVEAEL